MSSAKCFSPISRPLHPVVRAYRVHGGGKTCIRGMCVTVSMIGGQIGSGHIIEALLADYPYPEREDVLQAICYEAWRAEEREILFANVSSWYIGCGGDVLHLFHFS